MLHNLQEPQYILEMKTTKPLLINHSFICCVVYKGNYYNTPIR